MRPSRLVCIRLFSSEHREGSTRFAGARRPPRFSHADRVHVRPRLRLGMAHGGAARREPRVDDALPRRLPAGDDGRHGRVERPAPGGAFCGTRVRAGRRRAAKSSCRVVAAAVPGLRAGERAVGDAGAVAWLARLAGLGPDDPGFLGGAERRAGEGRADARVRRARGGGVRCGGPRVTSVSCGRTG